MCRLKRKKKWKSSPELLNQFFDFSYPSKRVDFSEFCYPTEEFLEEDLEYFDMYPNFYKGANFKRNKKKNKKLRYRKRENGVYKDNGIVNNYLYNKMCEKENRICENINRKKDNRSKRIGGYRPKPWRVKETIEVDYNVSRFVINNDDSDYKLAIKRSLQTKRKAKRVKKTLTRSERLSKLLEELQYRDITPEDYTLLCELDESVKPKTVEVKTLDEKTTEVKFEKKSANEEGNDVEENETCPVCMEEYCENDIIRVLGICQHKFHKKCIDEYLINFATKCPICRKKI